MNEPAADEIDLESVRERLLAWMKDFSSLALGFSGGLDSSVVAMAAKLALGDSTVAITAVSPVHPETEIELARKIAAWIGIRHVELPGREMNDPRFLPNDPERCYYCKRIRFEDMISYANSFGIAAVLDGSNADDAHDYRPGGRAVRELGVRSPLAELGITKTTVRRLAAAWNLPNVAKPPEPCLASRFAYGEPITAERLRDIEEAEAFLRSLGFSETRVRWHGKGLVRIEVKSDQIPKLTEPEIRGIIVQKFKSLGFVQVSLDLEGFRSGSMNMQILCNAK